MKKKLAMLLAGVMLTGSLLTGCGGDSSSGDTTSDTKKRHLIQMKLEN